MINGASGGVGSFAVQIAKDLGTEVTAVCSTRKMEMVRSLHPNHIIDYTTTDVTQTDQPYDLILDAAAYGSAFCLMVQLMMLVTYHMTVAEIILILVMISTDIHMPFKRDLDKHSFN